MNASNGNQQQKTTCTTLNLVLFSVVKTQFEDTSLYGTQCLTKWNSLFNEDTQRLNSLNINTTERVHNLGRIMVWFCNILGNLGWLPLMHYSTGEKVSIVLFSQNRFFSSLRIHYGIINIISIWDIILMDSSYHLRTQCIYIISRAHYTPLLTL